jgi:hypothetical protein
MSAAAAQHFAEADVWLGGRGERTGAGRAASIRREMSPVRPDAIADALSRYRAAVQANVSAEKLARLGAGVDPDLLATVRWSQTRARAARPRPDPVFVGRLRRLLTHAARRARVGAPRA